MRPRAFAAFSPRPERGGSTTILSAASLEARSERGKPPSRYECTLHSTEHCGASRRRNAEERFDCQHLIEITRQVMSKQASAGIEIECGSSCLMADDDFDKLVDQETVGLKEGATAYPVVMFHSVVQERIRADGLRGFGMD